MKRILRGVVVDGKRVYFEPKEIMAKLAKMEGQRFQEILEKEEDIRTLSDNSYYWGVVIYVSCDSMGYDSDSSEDKLIVSNAFKMMFACHPDDHGLLVLEHTHLMTKERFDRFVASIKRYMLQEYNCRIPDKGEYMDEMEIERIERQKERKKKYFA